MYRELTIHVYAIYAFIGLCALGALSMICAMCSWYSEEKKLKDALKLANEGTAGRETKIVELQTEVEEIRVRRDFFQAEANRFRELSAADLQYVVKLQKEKVENFANGYSLGKSLHEPEPLAKKTAKPRVKKSSGK